MAKLRKRIRKDMKKLSKQLYSPKGLTLKQTFDFTTSFYGRKKEKKPYLTFSARGDFKISVAKLVVISVCTVTSILLLVLLFKSLFESLKERRRRRELEEYYDLDDEEVPF